jgi:predicted porin
MNKKLLALAVSAAVMAPVAAQADVTVYGRINNAIDIHSGDNIESTTDISNVSSRFGIKASSDLGNGMTASARYEFATTTDKEVNSSGNNPSDLRIGTVGISGGFGSITVGNQWSAFYDIVGTHIDPTYTLGYYIYSSFVEGPYRASNTIKYSNSFGPVYLELDVRLNESDETTADAEKLNGDGVGLGVSFAATDNLTLAIAFDSEDASVADGTNDKDRAGVAAKWDSGGWFAMLGWQETDIDGGDVIDNVSLYGGTTVGDSTKLMAGWQDASSDLKGDADQLVLGVYHNMGGGLKLYYEGTAVSYDDGDDIDVHLLGMRIDF